MDKSYRLKSLLEGVLSLWCRLLGLLVIAGGTVTFPKLLESIPGFDFFILPLAYLLLVLVSGVWLMTFPKVLAQGVSSQVVGLVQWAKSRKQREEKVEGIR